MKLKTRRAESGDVAAIKRLTDEYLAPEYYSEEALDHYIHAERSLFYVVTDMERDDAVVAYFYAFLSTLDEAMRVLHVQEKPEALLGYDGDAPVGVYKTVSIDKAYRRFGICSAFIRDLEPVMRAHGAKLILGPAMRSPAGVVPMEGILHDHGFAPIAEIIRPWEDMDMYCPYCGRYHCICDAVFYIKHLDRTEDEDVRESDESAR